MQNINFSNFSGWAKVEYAIDNSDINAVDSEEITFYCFVNKGVVIELFISLYERELRQRQDSQPLWMRKDDEDGMAGELIAPDKISNSYKLPPFEFHAQLNISFTEGEFNANGASVTNLLQCLHNSNIAQYELSKIVCEYRHGLGLLVDNNANKPYIIKGKVTQSNLITF